METESNAVSFKILQQKEIDGSALYRQIARLTKNENERETLLAISNDEYKHAAISTELDGFLLVFLVSEYVNFMDDISILFIISYMN